MSAIIWQAFAIPPAILTPTFLLGWACWRSAGPTDD